MATFPINRNRKFVPPELHHDRELVLPEGTSQIVKEVNFLRMVCFERKRAERSGRPFLLAVISSRSLLLDEAGTVFVRAIERALSTSIRETDTLGWYEDGAKLAILFREIGCSSANVELIVRKVTTALQNGLSREQFQALSLNFCVFPQDRNLDSEDRDDFNLIVYPDLLRCNSQRTAQLLKRTLDIFGALLSLVAFFPLFLLIAFLVRLTSPGPILFRQRRIGQYGKEFVFLKFRSMYSGSNSTIHQEYIARLIEGKGDIKQRDGKSSEVYKLTADPRVTPLGRVLRKTSLDELPQLLNVLIGDMSLVGPRPPLPYEFKKYKLWHRRRILEVKPGITGLWQVMGRSKTTFDDMVRLDLRYARTWSLSMDAKILWRTPLAVIRAEGAY